MYAIAVAVFPISFIQLVTSQCPQNCLNDCTHYGECNGCKEGKTSRTCDYLCDSRCAKCSQTSQQFCHACIHRFYTSTCAIPCYLNCATGQCDFYNGNCVNGCLSGFWGDTCGEKCSNNCTQLECHRNGSCIQGCIDDYGGVFCNITMTSNKTTVLRTSSSFGIVTSNTSSESSTEVFTVNNCQEGRSSLGPVLGGAVIGAVVIRALLVGSFAFVLHRSSGGIRVREHNLVDT